MTEDLELVEQKWRQLTAFCRKEALKTSLWKEVVAAYRSPARAYHNIGHIAAMFRLLDAYLEQVQNPAVIGFAILYHDVVYDTNKRNNEQQSAAFAAAHLNKLKVKDALVGDVATFIEATTGHNFPAGHHLSADLELFLDLDLAILGAPWNVYDEYRKNIRQEYLQYRKEQYRAGRKNALEHLLARPSIYFTEPFKEQFEAAARLNLQKEMEVL